MLNGIFFFAFGAIVGSFLNVVILRYHTGRSINGRSKCFSCQSRLRWFELLPVISYFVVRGKCRTCRAKISLQYLFVELLTGVIFLLTSSPKGSEVSYGASQLEVTSFSPLLTSYFLIIFSLLIIIFVYDFRHTIIPDAFVYSFIGLSFAGMFFDGVSLHFNRPPLFRLLAGPLLFLPFFLMWAVSRGRWMGLGDGKLALGMGWFLGLSGGVSAVLLSFWIGAAVGVFIMTIPYILRFFSRMKDVRYPLFSKEKHLTMKSEIPFAPFLILALWIVFFSGISVLPKNLFL